MSVFVFVMHIYNIEHYVKAVHIVTTYAFDVCVMNFTHVYVFVCRDCVHMHTQITPINT